MKPASLLKHLESLPDPRSERNRKHLLVDVVAIAVCGVLVGCDGPTAIRLWAEQREDWLRGFLALPEGLPSKDCLRWVLSRLKPDAFAGCFSTWVAESLSTNAEGRLIAVDGKTLRRSHDQKNGLGALHVVSAWASEAGFSLGQLATDEKSNEITAIPELLDAIDLQDAVVTIDAMGCQKEIAAQIVKEKGDYVLALKGNHEKLYDAVREHFDALHEAEFEGSPCRLRRTKGQGARPGRRALLLPSPAARGDQAVGERLGRVNDDRPSGLDHPAGWQGDQRGALLPEQPGSRREAFRRGVAGALGDRELAALGARRDVPRRREPLTRPPPGREPGRP